jgi:hypothetical protein
MLGNFDRYGWVRGALKSFSEKKSHRAALPKGPILVSLGPKRGASVLPLTKSGVAVGGFPTSLIKGKSLFIPRYRKEFGVN